MNDLINVEFKDGQIVVGTREVAINFEKQHSEVLKKIHGYDRGGEHINGLMDDFDSSVNTLQYFIPNEYHDSSGKVNKEYLLTRDGFSLLVMGFTGAKALGWKVKYINAFNRMEDRLKNPYGTLSPELQAIFAIDAKQQQIEVRVDKLENETTINYAQQQELKMTVSNRVILLLGGKQAPAYKKLAKKAFSECWNSYYQYVGVNAYANTAKVDYDRGRSFLMSWMPSQEMQGMIYTVNRGGVLY